jgi:predicted type IV restriction endonuclease
MAAMSAAQSEAFSRVLIDRALEFSGWNLLDPHQVRFELHTATGRADYVLGGGRGPICVLEAKREDAASYDAREQGFDDRDQVFEALRQSTLVRQALLAVE